MQTKQRQQLEAYVRHSINALLDKYVGAPLTTDVLKQVHRHLTELIAGLVHSDMPLALAATMPSVRIKQHEDGSISINVE